MSRKTKSSGNPLKNSNSMGVKNEEYTAHNNMNFVHVLYHLHFYNLIFKSITASIFFSSSSQKSKQQGKAKLIFKFWKW